MRVQCDLLIPEAGVHRLVLRPWGYLAEGETVAATDLTVGLLAGKLQLSYRVPSRAGRLHGGGHVLLISMTDLPGLVYWTARLVQ